MSGTQPTFAPPGLATTVAGFHQAPLAQAQQPQHAGPHAVAASSGAIAGYPLRPVSAQTYARFVPAPADGHLVLRITKLAEYTTRNGPAFEQQVRSKQATNPEYAFLQGGEGSDFYQWCIHCMAAGLPYNVPPPGMGDSSSPGGSGQAGPTAQAAVGPASSSYSTPWAAQQAAPMPPEVASGFAQVLQGLQGSQVSHAFNGFRIT
jgi:Surp module